jgi:ABC-type glycerol-3-phosphate transport system substrate-binding protein
MGRRLTCACAVVAVLSLAAAACSKSTKSPTATSSSPTASASASESAAAIPTATTITLPVTYGFYDGHVDTMLSTDVSNKAQATALHVNYSAAMLTQAAGTYPSLFRVSGRAAAGQPQVFGSEPGKPDYSPLWQEITVTWKLGVTPVLLTKDDQVRELAGKGMLTLTPTPIVLNCPIVTVG